LLGSSTASRDIAPRSTGDKAPHALSHDLEEGE
jgi:hypothetical protein